MTFVHDTTFFLLMTGSISVEISVNDSMTYLFELNDVEEAFRYLAIILPLDFQNSAIFSDLVDFSEKEL